MINVITGRQVDNLQNEIIDQAVKSYYQASREKERMCNLFTATCFLFVKTESLLSARTSVVNLIWFGTIIKTSCLLSW